MKRLLLALSVSGACCAAVAGPSTWEYTITGMVPWSTIAWIHPQPSDATLSGRFSADDLDQDGVLRLDEVVSFTLGGVGVLPWVYWDDPRCGCEGGRHSSLDRFSYSPSAGLDFAAHTGFGWHETFSGEIGVGVVQTFFPGNLGASWGPGTRVTVTQIPEPSTAWLLAAGVGLLGARGWRARR
jgi:hypothetical protein